MYVSLLLTQILILIASLMNDSHVKNIRSMLIYVDSLLGIINTCASGNVGKKIEAHGTQRSFLLNSFTVCGTNSQTDKKRSTDQQNARISKKPRFSSSYCYKNFYARKSNTGTGCLPEAEVYFYALLASEHYIT